MAGNTNVSGATLHANSERAAGPAGSRPLDDDLMIMEQREILAALRTAGGQRTRAARLLGISRSRLYRRMEALGLEPKTPESGADA